jgi:hypothetical protein
VTALSLHLDGEHYIIVPKFKGNVATDDDPEFEIVTSGLPPSFAPAVNRLLAEQRAAGRRWRSKFEPYAFVVWRQLRPAG